MGFCSLLAFPPMNTVLHPHPAPSSLRLGQVNFHQPREMRNLVSPIQYRRIKEQSLLAPFHERITLRRNIKRIASLGRELGVLLLLLRNLLRGVMSVELYRTDVFYCARAFSVERSEGLRRRSLGVRL